MDYIDLRRIKLWGKARVIEDDPALVERLRDAEDSSSAERAILFDIEAWDMNCQQHIHRRFPQEIVVPFVEKLQKRIQELEAKLDDSA
jgi:predicted pyridoxine 5'-phosphate oxidase superfamily flavin-nucleotide-binding protein